MAARVVHMRKLALIAALMVTSPAAAQVSALNGQLLSSGGQTESALSPTTGVICTEEIAATFCNVSTRPSSGGYGSGSVTAGSTTPPASIPPCPEFPPANELCD
jgi:hypothetical protein